VSETTWVALAGIAATVLTALGGTYLNERSRKADRDAQSKESAEAHRRSREVTSITVRQTIQDAARERLRSKLESVMELTYELRTNVEHHCPEAGVMYDKTKGVVEASRGPLSLEPRGIDLVQSLDWLHAKVVIYYQTSQMYENAVKTMPNAPTQYYERLEQTRQDVRDAIREIQRAARQALDELSNPVAETHQSTPGD